MTRRRAGCRGHCAQLSTGDIRGMDAPVKQRKVSAQGGVCIAQTYKSTRNVISHEERRHMMSYGVHMTCELVSDRLKTWPRATRQYAENSRARPSMVSQVARARQPRRVSAMLGGARKLAEKWRESLRNGVNLRSRDPLWPPHPPADHAMEAHSCPLTRVLGAGSSELLMIGTCASSLALVGSKSWVSHLICANCLANSSGLY